MFEDYFLEEYGRETIVTECGFCMYVLNKEASEVFVTDFHVKEEFRKTYEGKKMFGLVQDIARNNGCEMITALVSSGIKNPSRVTKILKCYLSMGFEIMDFKHNQAILRMMV